MWFSIYSLGLAYGFDFYVRSMTYATCRLLNSVFWLLPAFSEVSPRADISFFSLFSAFSGSARFLRRRKISIKMKLIMRNEANFSKSQIFITAVLTTNYNKKATVDTWPKRTQTKPIKANLVPSAVEGSIKFTYGNQR